VARRLGEVLVQQGVITPEQLRAALRSQLTRGGQLGTCLIELGHIDSDSLGAALAAFHRCSHATADRLGTIPPEIIELVPRQVVERRRVIPIDVHDNALHLAMVNPGDRMALEEVEFATEMNVQPWVAPEIRIVEAMERWYGIRATPRFQRIRSARQVPKPVRTAPATGWDAVEVIPLAHATGIPASTHAVSHPTGAEVGASNAVETPIVVPLPSHGADADWTAILRELFLQVPGAEARAALHRPGEAVSEASLRHELERISSTLSDARGPGAVAREVLDCASRGMSRCVLFVVREGQARVWDWRGVELDPAAVARLRFPVDEGSLFELAAGADWYRGPIPQEPSRTAVYRKLGLAVPTEALIVPIYFEARLAAFLYGDGGDLGRILGKTEMYHGLARKMGIALTILALKHRLSRP